MHPHFLCVIILKWNLQEQDICGKRLVESDMRMSFPQRQESPCQGVVSLRGAIATKQSR